MSIAIQMRGWERGNSWLTGELLGQSCTFQVCSYTAVNSNVNQTQVSTKRHIDTHIHLNSIYMYCNMRSYSPESLITAFRKLSAKILCRNESEQKHLLHVLHLVVCVALTP